MCIGPLHDQRGLILLDWFICSHSAIINIWRYELLQHRRHTLPFFPGDTSIPLLDLLCLGMGHDYQHTCSNLGHIPRACCHTIYRYQLGTSLPNITDIGILSFAAASKQLATLSSKYSPLQRIANCITMCILDKYRLFMV